MDTPIVPRQIRKVYEGRIFTVQVESIVLPHGGTLDAEIVRHPGSVVLIPITGAGTIILVRQYRHALGRWAWELPGGSISPGEHLAQAATRECHEEIGLIPERLVLLGSFYPTPGYCDERMDFFLAESLREPSANDAAAHPDEDEGIVAQAFTSEEIRRMVEAREVVDMKTVVGLSLISSR
jgi:ADP-ribose pyrophosphatase